ncbi:MAG: hypothetical protein FWE29_04835 [Defluviitaleaceae bacterium]|nr:hypothetical protein [Defluviitaleaceae bacterium]
MNINNPEENKPLDKTNSLLSDWDKKRTPSSYSKIGIFAMAFAILSVILVLFAFTSQFLLMRGMAQENQWQPFTFSQRHEIESARSFNLDFVSVVFAITGAVFGLIAAGNNYDKLGRIALFMSAVRILVFPFAETYFFALFFRSVL